MTVWLALCLSAAAEGLPDDEEEGDYEDQEARPDPTPLVNWPA